MAICRACAPGIGIGDLEWERRLGELQEECDESMRDGKCAHIRLIHKAHSKANDENALFIMLANVASYAFSCGACLEFLGESLIALTNYIQHLWDDQKYPDDPIRDATVHRGANRARIYEHDLKRLLLQRSSKRKATTNVIGQSAMGNGVSFKRCDHDQVGPFLSCTRRVFQHRENLVLTLAYDAGAFGFPKEDTMLYAWTDGIIRGWAAPMALWGLRRVPKSGRAYVSPGRF